MSVRPSLLAILAIGPCYGNQLRAEFERRSGGTRALNVGQVYSTLERLERDGCVTKDQPDPAGLVRYRITPAGRTEAAQWLETPIARRDSRDDLAQKIALAFTLPHVDSASIVARQRESTAGELARLGAERTPISERRIVLEALIAAAHAEIEWLDRAEVVGAALLPYGLDSEVPRRGRPAATRAPE